MRFGFLTQEWDDPKRICQQLKIGEENGFDSFWATEHHQTNLYGWPAPFERLTIAASETDLDLATTVIPLPLHNALNIAERAAFVDRLSGGRLTIGVSMGHNEKVFDAYDIDEDERAGRLVEGLMILRDYLSLNEGEVFNFEGKFYHISDWEPKVVSSQNPRPTLWLGGWGPMTMKRAVKLADGWLPGWIGDNFDVQSRQNTIREICNESNINWNDVEKPIMKECVIAESRNEAKKLGKQYQYEPYKSTYVTEEWTHPLLSEELVTNYESLASNRFLYGTPDDIIQQISDMVDEVDVDIIGCRLYYPGMDDETFENQIELFGNHVIPSFK